MKTENVSLKLSLTGSSFFDMVIHKRARELAAKYPGLSVSRDKESITISGMLHAEDARRFRQEVE